MGLAARCPFHSTPSCTDGRQSAKLKAEQPGIQTVTHLAFALN
jgi:hypothetical protein